MANGTKNSPATTSLNQRRYRPMGVADLFDEAFDLYKNNFLMFLCAAAIIFVPLNVVMDLWIDPMIQGYIPNDPTGASFEAMVTDLERFFVALLAATVITAFSYLLLGGPVIEMVSQRYLGRPAQFGKSFALALRRLLPLLIGAIIVTLLTGLVTPFCILPGLYVFARFACLPQVVTLEPKLSTFRAVGRTWKLAGENTWRIVGVLLMLSVIASVIGIALGGALTWILGHVPLENLGLDSGLIRGQDLAGDVSGAFTSLVMSPFSFTLLTLVYYDLRIRQEGYDMTIIADQLGFITSEGGSRALPQAMPPPRLKPTRRGRFWQKRTPTKGAST